MKTLYTSSYQDNGKNPDAIGISFIVPSWFRGKTMANLAPTLDMVRRWHNWDNPIGYSESDYKSDYIGLLESRNVDANQLVDELPDGAILLCYERPDEFCHRHLLADWIQERVGVIVTECKTQKQIKVDNRDKMVDSFINF